MQVPGQRWALLTNAGLPAGVLEELRYDGSAAEFVVNLVQACGSVENLVLVLNAAAEVVGVDRRAEFHALARELTAPAEGPVSTEDFLDALAVDTSSSAALSPYRAIDRLFVPPRQYARIREVLAERNAVVILGDPHVGKTYTAVRLLWESYRDEGRPPKWLNSNRLAAALQSPEGSFEARIKELFPAGSTVYLEDPFGTTVPLDMRDFVDNLKAFFRIVRDGDRRVVITSRSHVFNQVIPDVFAEHVVTLTQQLVLEKSYDADDLALLIRRYLDEYEVAWRTEATPPVIDRIAGELHAPHNIALFLIATKDVPGVADALAQLVSYRDVVEQFALTLRELPLWQLGFLCVAYFFSSFDIDAVLTRRLFDDAVAAGELGAAELVSWDRAVRELAEFCTEREMWRWSFIGLRHPSIEEAFDHRVRADPRLLEAVRLLMARAERSGDARMVVAAFRCFVHYSDHYWRTTWGPEFFGTLLHGKDPYLREMTRLHVITESAHLTEAQRELLHDEAERTWNERFLIRLLLGAPVSPPRRDRLVERLTTTWDDWVRYQLARQVTWLCPRQSEQVLSRLAHDPSTTVAKAAVAAMAERG
jgi:hypothetical protein